MTRRPPRSAARAPRAFSFIEVFLTAAILLIGIATLTQGLPIAFGLIEHDRKLADADRIAVSVLEEMIAREQRGTLSTGSGSQRFNPQAQPDGDGMYTANWRVVGNFTVPRGRLIEVTVIWSERGVTKRNTLTSFGFR